MFLSSFNPSNESSFTPDQLALIAEKNKLPTSDDAEDDDDDADGYFQYFQAACECKHAKIVEIALDGVHTLLGSLFSLLPPFSIFNFETYIPRLPPPPKISIYRAWIS